MEASTPLKMLSGTPPGSSWPGYGRKFGILHLKMLSGRPPGRSWPGFGRKLTILHLKVLSGSPGSSWPGSGRKLSILYRKVLSGKPLGSSWQEIVNFTFENALNELQTGQLEPWKKAILGQKNARIRCRVGAGG